MSVRRRLGGAAAVLLTGAFALAAHTGWLGGARGWEEATGWRAIPPELRPGSSLPWPAAAGPPPALGWLGHGGLLVEWHGARIAIDPNLAARCSIARRLFPPPLAASEVGALDAVLLTHAHYDHLDRPTLAALPAVGLIVLPAGSEEEVAGLRSDARVVGLAPWQRRRLGELEVVAVPAAHNGGRHHPLPSVRRAAGWILRAGSGALYVAGDTGPGNDFEAIARAERPALAVLPIGAYSPSFPMRLYHLAPEDAVQVARRLGVGGVVPYHFGTFVLALDRPAAALPRFARAAAAAGVEWAMPALARPAPPGGGAVEGGQ